MFFWSDPRNNLNSFSFCNLQILIVELLFPHNKIPKKIDMRIKDESVEQVDSFRYLWWNISRYLNCCQEVKQRIAMTKEVLKGKGSIFCGPLEKELKSG